MREPCTDELAFQIDTSDTNPRLIFCYSHFKGECAVLALRSAWDVSAISEVFFPGFKMTMQRTLNIVSCMGKVWCFFLYACIIPCHPRLIHESHCLQCKAALYSSFRRFQAGPILGANLTHLFVIGVRLLTTSFVGGKFQIIFQSESLSRSWILILPRQFNCACWRRVLRENLLAWFSRYASLVQNWPFAFLCYLRNSAVGAVGSWMEIMFWTVPASKRLFKGSSRHSIDSWSISSSTHIGRCSSDPELLSFGIGLKLWLWDIQVSSYMLISFLDPILKHAALCMMSMVEHMPFQKNEDVLCALWCKMEWLCKFFALRSVTWGWHGFVWLTRYAWIWVIYYDHACA